MRRAAKIDASQTEIVSALRKAGACVQSLGAVGSGCPDLLVGYGGKTILMEVKEPYVRGRLRSSQIEWHMDWVDKGGPLVVIDTAEQALGILREVSLGMR